MCSGRVTSSCSISGTRHATLVTNALTKVRIAHNDHTLRHSYTSIKAYLIQKTLFKTSKVTGRTRLLF